MELIIGLGIVLLLLTSLILPWVNRSQMQLLRYEIKVLKQQLTTLFTLIDKHGITLPPEIISGIMNPWQHPADTYTVTEKSTVTTTRIEETPSIVSAITVSPITTAKVVPEQADKLLPNFKLFLDFEQQFGARLPVWIGGIALALSGFFLVKYSIETGLLSPLVRVVLGLCFGVGLLYAARQVWKKPDMANGVRIAQSLSGAGIAVLYISLFAATSLYGLIPFFIGFITMAAVTATAVVLSLIYGMPIALLGLVGGFITPALLSTDDPDAPLLFIYLYMVLTGLMVVIRKQQWWLMAIPSVIATIGWVCIWLFGKHFSANDSIYLGLFLIAISITIIHLTKDSYAKEESGFKMMLSSVSSLNYITLGASILLMGAISIKAGFGMIEWGLFGFISIGTIALAWFNQRLYGFAPWIAMPVNLVMLVVWQLPDSFEFALYLCLFGGLYIGSGYLLQSRSEKPLLWALLSASAAIGYYLLGYAQLHSSLANVTPYLWGTIALLFAIAAVFVLQEIMRHVSSSHPQKQQLLAVYAVAATGFISLGLTIELPREFLSVAFALELAALSWINQRVEVKALRPVAAVLAAIFGFLLLPQCLLLVQLTAYSLVEVKLELQQGIPIVNWPLFQLGLPALCFALTAYLLRQQFDGRLVRICEVAAIALIGVMGYYLTRHAFHIEEDILFVKAGFIERGTITNILFVYGLSCLFLGRHTSREAISLSGLILILAGMFRVIYFDVLIANPLFTTQQVGTYPLINGLLLAYALPAFWISRATPFLSDVHKSNWSLYARGTTLLLVFVWVSLTIRQLFHGDSLDAGIAQNAEIYSYSAAWLCLGITMLLYGTSKHDQQLRIASLLIMLLSVAKVFLYDASELEGLLRILSFFGLGLSLIGLSWFYSRFVFTSQQSSIDKYPT